MNKDELKEKINQLIDMSKKNLKYCEFDRYNYGLNEGRIDACKIILELIGGKND